MIISAYVKIPVVFPVIPPGDFFVRDKAGAIFFAGVDQLQGLIHLGEQPAPGYYGMSLQKL